MTVQTSLSKREQILNQMKEEVLNVVSESHAQDDKALIIDMCQTVKSSRMSLHNLTELAQGRLLQAGS